MGPGEGRAGVTGKGATRMSPKLTVGEVARLVRAMTCKCAAVDLFHGGAKAGILGDARSPGKERTLRAFARAPADEVPREYVFGLDQLGATVVAVSTAAGWVHDPDGLDLDVAASTTARLVIEAANLATTVAAREVLHEGGVLIVPDFIANAGGIVAAAHPTDASHSPFVVAPAGVLSMISDKLRGNTTQVLTDGLTRRIPPGRAAMDLAQARVLAAMTARGVKDHGAALAIAGSA